MNRTLNLIQPNWPLTNKVGAITTTRSGGVSKPPFSTLNLATHVGDAAEDVVANRARLQQEMACQYPIAWLEQVHSSEVYAVEHPILPSQLSNHLPSHGSTDPLNAQAKADALYTTIPGQPLGILTADCLPILVASQSTSEVAAVHAGWRGLVGGIVDNTLRCFSSDVEDLVVWLGPAIGPLSYEVGEEVIEQFCSVNSALAQCFQTTTGQAANKAMLDLYLAAKVILNNKGVSMIFGGEFCTYRDHDFFSYRRDNTTGRMATLIWSQ